jgi:acyl phosphate:glycerol-3-phosphate acyltransferase
VLILVIISYLLGSICFGKIIARMARGVDISDIGSQNVGATNVAREIGLKWGFLTLVLDSLKGFLPTAAAFVLHKGDFNPETVASVCGLAAFIGHNYSIFLKFKGGKGVATALGVFLVLCPVCVVGSVALFLVLVGFMGYISLASIAAAVSMPFFLLISGKPPVLLGVAFLISGFITFAHRGNILRLLQKREPKWRKSAPM